MARDPSKALKKKSENFSDSNPVNFQRTKACLSFPIISASHLIRNPTIIPFHKVWTRLQELNYGYAVLLSTVLQKLFGVGLDPTFGISHVARECSTPLAYDLVEPFRPCVDWRVYQWVKKHPDRAEWEVTKEFRGWVIGFPLERVDYLDITLEIQGVIEDVVRGFRHAIMNNQPRLYKPWTPRNTKWAG
jgi:hypothetical protein